MVLKAKRYFEYWSVIDSRLLQHLVCHSLLWGWLGGSLTDSSVLYAYHEASVTSAIADLSCSLWDTQLCTGLVERVGGLETEVEWSHQLSLGEQQRVAFVRLLLHCPKLAFLDEATGALDTPTEAALYTALRTQCASFVSVGERTRPPCTLLMGHEQSLTAPAVPQGDWAGSPARGCSSNIGCPGIRVSGKGSPVLHS